MDYARDNGYPRGNSPRDHSIFVCAPSGSCSDFGHVGWVVRGHPNGSFDSTEMFCGGPCGVHERHRGAGFATAGFIYDPGGGNPDPPDPRNDDAAFVSENVPDGTEVDAGARFTKRWRVRNTGDTTWTRDADYLWTFDGEERFGADEQTRLGGGERIGPGQEKEWSVELRAPESPGRHRGYWRMDRFGTHRFGQRCWVEVVVRERHDPDEEGDGVKASEDCDDQDAERRPGREEVCDRKDNDCDGETDEDLSRVCHGECGEGEERCEGGTWTPCSVRQPSEEACNGEDDDCDGDVDEGLSRPCSGPCGDGDEVCVEGWWICDADPVAETCNGKDDDCDGEADEGLRCLPGGDPGQPGDDGGDGPGPTADAGPQWDPTPGEDPNPVMQGGDAGAPAAGGSAGFVDPQIGCRCGVGEGSASAAAWFRLLRR